MATLLLYAQGPYHTTQKQRGHLVLVVGPESLGKVRNAEGKHSLEVLSQTLGEEVLRRDSEGEGGKSRDRNKSPESLKEGL